MRKIAAEASLRKLEECRQGRPRAVEAIRMCLTAWGPLSNAALTEIIITNSQIKGVDQTAIYNALTWMRERDLVKKHQTTGKITRGVLWEWKG